MDEYSHDDAWDDPAKVLSLLARSIVDNQLVLVLGAGASMGCGLPSWGDLVQNAHELARVPRAAKVDDNAAIEALAHTMQDTPGRFLQVIKDALYSTREPVTGALKPFVEQSALRSELLEAICTVVMLSCRRGHGTLVTFNFDDLAETYLMRRGIFAYPYSNQPDWFHNEDVSVLHPHGFLSRRPMFPSSESIALTALDFDNIIGDVTNPWHVRLLSLFQSAIPLFVGLSGTDKNLSNLITKARGTHVSKATGRRYWGIRLCVEGDPNIDTWKHRGVWCETFAHYNEIPDYLMKVCHASAEMLVQAKLFAGEGRV
ncbi:SIR2 family protein [Paraburkholderia sp. MPAMCS5]|uniref:SIR2 family protein n=1 Tax=Paraburkholderia sp. MPAMCS5 TaxID=3112563 RepID=UPI002E18BB7D|nr:SIR2 family protein [Paraburkholderia sp. MPAMCS5]